MNLAKESNGDIILFSNSEEDYFKLVFDDNEKDYNNTFLEGFKIESVNLIPPI